MIRCDGLVQMSPNNLSPSKYSTSNDNIAGNGRINSISKVFEKLILHRIMEIEDESKVDLTGKNQNGFIFPAIWRMAILSHNPLKVD